MAKAGFRSKAEIFAFIEVNRVRHDLPDNAFIESFFHSMKSEIYHGYRFNTDDEIHNALKSYLPFYNSDRLHSSLDYVSPATYERQAR